MEQKLIYCCICNGPIDWHTTPEGEVYWTQGHNAEPIKDGRCCTTCNGTKVLPARLYQAMAGKSPPDRVL